MPLWNPRMRSRTRLGGAFDSVPILSSDGGSLGLGAHGRQTRNEFAWIDLQGDEFEAVS